MNISELVANDYKCHINNGVDLNPYSTPSARYMWEKGFNNLPLLSWEGDINYNIEYQRGKAAKKLYIGANK